jgi:ABC-2 type transport system ATP-binding protein
MILLDKISKKYSQKIILDSISITFERGSITSLLGINGAGKSTISYILAGIKKSTSGNILYNNRNISENLFEYKKNIGFCQQTPNLDSFITLRENLFFAGKYFGLSNTETNSQIDYLAELLNLKEYLSSYDYLISGGFKQRFMIARSLIHNPKYLILDEPTVAMDPRIRKEFWETILTLKKKNIGIILTTHYLDEAEYLSDRIVILHKGHIKINSTVDSLLQTFEKKSLEEVFITFLNEQEKKELYF